jgi:hypothetical protein
MVLAAGESYTMNITFTQNPLNGLTLVWDPREWDNTTAPGESSDGTW